MRILRWLAGVVAGLCLLPGAASAQPNSGFLGSHYAKLKDAQSPSGKKVKRWLAPGIKPGAYEFLLLDKTQYYPPPKSSDQVSEATLNEISAYLDEALRRELAGVVKLATEPGPKTLRFRPAITAAAPKEAGLKPYQYMPLAFVATGGKKAVAASLAVEYDARDLDTDQVVAAGMREEGGVELKSATEKLTLAHFKPVIDGWAKDMRALIEIANKLNR